MSDLFKFLVIAILFTYPLATKADTPGVLNGSWVIDANQTEELVKRLGPPPKNAEWLPMVLGNMFQTVLTFSDGNMTVSRYSASQTATTYRLVSQQSGKFEYQLETSQGEEKDTITISFLNGKNINIKSSKMELQEYGVWKPANKPNPQTWEKDFNLALEAWKATVQNILPVIRGTPNLPVNPDAAR